MEKEIIAPIPEFSWFMTVKEYADLKKVSVQSVYGKIKRSTLEVKRIGNFTLVREFSNN